ncbi:putative membrane protein [Clostridioides difficile CD160]|nr:putative membrane protein [Clostridioides difficile CD160]
MFAFGFSLVILLLVLLLTVGIFVGIIKKNKPILVTSSVTLSIILITIIVIWNLIPDAW